MISDINILLESGNGMGHERERYRERVHDASALKGRL
jgi:hypothetical protein